MIKKKKQSKDSLTGRTTTAVVGASVPILPPLLREPSKVTFEMQRSNLCLERNQSIDSKYRSKVDLQTELVEENHVIFPLFVTSKQIKDSVRQKASKKRRESMATDVTSEAMTRPTSVESMVPLPHRRVSTITLDGNAINTARRKSRAPRRDSNVGQAKEYQLEFSYSRAVEKVVRRSLRQVTALNKLLPQTRDVQSNRPDPRKQNVRLTNDAVDVTVHNLNKVEMAGLEDFVLKRVTRNPDDESNSNQSSRSARTRRLRAVRKRKKSRTISTSDLDAVSGSAAAIIKREMTISRVSSRSESPDAAIPVEDEGDAEVNRLLHRMSVTHLNEARDDNTTRKKLAALRKKGPRNYYGEYQNLPPPLYTELSWEPERCETVLTPTSLAARFPEYVDRHQKGSKTCRF